MKKISKIKNIPLQDQPREKLVKFGAENLTDSELLALILRVGNKKENVIEFSRKILEKYNLKYLSGISYNEIRKINGIDKAKACQIIACFELAKRLFSQKEHLRQIKSSKDIFNFLSPTMKNLKKEVFVGIYLNSRNQIIREEKISIGTLDLTILHPREVFAPAITDGAVSFILCHNHPSGNFEPSIKDIKLTKDLIKASKIMKIKFLDHIIIGGDGYFSFYEIGMMK